LGSIGPHFSVPYEIYKAARRSFWLIVARTHGGMEVLTIDAGGKMVLPVFSFQEEGELFVRLEATEADWWPRETTTGELASLLLGLCARVDKVALDPLPGLGEREILGLLTRAPEHRSKALPASPAR
jgi:hypothetical protein